MILSLGLMLYLNLEGRSRDPSLRRDGLVKLSNSLACEQDDLGKQVKFSDILAREIPNAEFMHF